MDLETAGHLAGIQESIDALSERMSKLDISIQAILRTLYEGIPEFAAMYQANFEDLERARKAPSDAAALEQKLAAIRSTLPKTGQA
jgi:hypothetical protein